MCALEESRNSLHPFSFESFGQPDNRTGKYREKEIRKCHGRRSRDRYKELKKRVKEIKEDRLRKERQAERDKENEKKK